MSKTLDFKIFCFEAYKAHHKMEDIDKYINARKKTA